MEFYGPDRQPPYFVKALEPHRWKSRRNNGVDSHRHNTNGQTSTSNGGEAGVQANSTMLRRGSSFSNFFSSVAGVSSSPSHSRSTPQKNATRSQSSQPKQPGSSNSSSSDPPFPTPRRVMHHSPSSPQLLRAGALGATSQSQNPISTSERQYLDWKWASAFAPSEDSSSEEDVTDATTNHKEDAEYVLDPDVVPTWRLKERMKTMGVCLVMVTNIGTDPPDVNKPNPCAKLLCWYDPTPPASRSKSKVAIAQRLEGQYTQWQQRDRQLKYKHATDPTTDELRNLCLTMRRQARNERILFHFNGHGVPRPTANGEIWVFDKDCTKYIPLPVTELRQWLGKPSVIVLDCSGAGILMPFLAKPLPTTDDPSSTGDDATQEPNSTTSNATTTSGAPHDDANLDEAELAARSIRDVIVLCPTSENELLPMNPEYPADIFTSCLTTPIRMAILWFILQNPLSMGSLEPDAMNSIPGKLPDRKTPLGELNFIFTAITDTIAWNVLPSPLFQRLFRQDLLVASMFRNFLLADRILRSLNCTPVSYPALPAGVHNHPLWQAWDLACETCLCSLMREGLLRRADSPTHIEDESTATVSATATANGMTGIVSNGGDVTNQQRQPLGSEAPTTTTTPPSSNVVMPQILSAPFFAEQLTAFEIWLEFASSMKGSELYGHTTEMESPEQLPVVLQVLLSQADRVRALVLLRRFLDLGAWAINLALSVGIFPYVLKLLRSPIDEYKHVLVGIWAKVLAFDPSCQVDIVNNGALPHFINHLNWGLRKGTGPSSLVGIHVERTQREKDDAAQQRTMAAFILSAICFRYAQGQAQCLRQNLHGTCATLLASLEIKQNSSNEESSTNNVVDSQETMYEKRVLAEERVPPSFRLWLCICLGTLVQDNPVAQTEAYRSGVHSRLYARLDDDSHEVRAAACFALGRLIGSAVTKHQEPAPSQKNAPNTPATPSTDAAPNRINTPNSGLPSTLSHGMLSPMGNLSAMQPMRPTFQPNNGGGGVPVQPGLYAGMPGSTLGAPHAGMGPAQGMMGFQPQGTNHQPWPQHSQQQHQQNGMLGQQPMGRSPMPQPQTQSYNSGNANNTSGLVLGHQGGRYMQAPQDQLTGTMKNNTTHPSLFVFQDSRRLELDLNSADQLIKATKDASPTVRNEAALALACFVDKYLPALTAVADESAASADVRSTSRSKADRLSSVYEDGEDSSSEDGYQDMGSDEEKKNTVGPLGLDRTLVEKFAPIWAALHSLQHNDPHSVVSSSVTAIVSVVNEHLLALKAESEKASNYVMTSTDDNGDVSGPLGLRRNASDHIHLGMVPESSGFERSASDRHIGEQNAIRSDAEKETPDTEYEFEYFLPETKFYQWKRLTFAKQDDSFAYEMEPASQDPLSEEGVVQAYRDRRNLEVHKHSAALTRQFSNLLPKPPKSRSPYVHNIFEGFGDGDPSHNDAVAQEDTEVAIEKRNLYMHEKALLINDAAANMLLFHPYEPALVVGDVNDVISIWNTDNAKLINTFPNGNAKDSRTTSVSWINEMSTSLLITGSDDGSVRIWDGIIKNDGDINEERPSLASAFFAAPDMVAGEKGGLVTEWQQDSGRLICGGSTKSVFCWDLQAEKAFHKFDRKSDICMTAMTTAWDYDPYEERQSKSSNSGIGPDIVVAGYGDGGLRVFDIRQPSPAMESLNPKGGKLSTSTRQRSRRRLLQYEEHSSWIVDVSFTGYGGKYEIASACTSGELKFWDLRYQSSLRTLEVQRSKMTALACHSKVPLFASGSPTQFIKLLTPDGDTLQMIRYHEELSGQRIGPVRCLDFHPHKLLLAAGAVDKIISLYAPKKIVDV